MPKHSLYFSQSVYDRLDLDSAGVEGLSARVSNLCMIALETMRDETPELQLNEWQALIDISNGLYRQTELGVQHQADSFRFSISESGPECNEKWGINCPTLARKFAGFSLIQQLATMEVCRRFWVRLDINKKYDSFDDILLAHGARIAKPQP